MTYISFDDMEEPALHLLPEGDEEKARRRNKYKRIRSRAREHYVQSCGYSYGKPPLPQVMYNIPHKDIAVYSNSIKDLVGIKVVRELMPTPQNQYFLRSLDKGEKSADQTISHSSSGDNTTLQNQDQTAALSGSTDNTQQHNVTASPSTSGENTPQHDTSESSLELSDIEGIEVSESPDNSIMAANPHIALSPFHGNAGETAEEWLVWYANYAAAVGWDEAKTYRMLPFYLKDHAYVWYNALPGDRKDTYGKLTTELKNRFNGSDGLDADLAILTLNQQQGESCTSYFTRILKVTAGRDYPDALITSIALKGLSADLKTIVMPQGHNSVEELRKAAILAERTVSATMTAAKVNSVDDITNKVLSAVTDKLSEVMAYDRGGSQSPSKWNQQQPPRQVQPRREQPQQQFDQNCSRCKGFPMVWWILSAFFVLCLVGCEGKEVFQRLNYGVVFQQKTQLYIAQDYWYHTFELELPDAFPLPRLPFCKKSNSTCRMISHFLSQLDSIRAETAERFNTTNQTARLLIPQTKVRKSRSRRSLLPFLGKISRGLFGTATVDDVNILAGHMNKLNKMASGLARALTQHEDHLSSVIKTANERMDNLMSGISENNLAIKFIQNELHTTTTNIEQSIDYMLSLLIDQVKTNTQLNHALDQFNNGIISLVNGKLSPLLIPENVMQSTVTDIQMLLQTKFNGFHLTLGSINDIYSTSKFLYARNNSRIFITIKLPVSYFNEPLTAYEVISVPVPINSTSKHATQLLDLPTYFIIAGNKQHYAGISTFDFHACSGKRVKYCQSNIALSPVTSASCVLALFGNDKSQVKASCDFRFVQNIIEPKITEISPNSLLIYRTPLVSLDCQGNHRMETGCDFCLFKVACKCSISTNDFYFSPRLASCHKHKDNITALHPVNLALLQHFFDAKYVEEILANTIFSKPVNVSIPHLKLFKHDMSDVVAADSKANLSLAKMAETAKKDAVIFQSLTEPLLNGQIKLNTDWPSTDDYILYINSAVTVILGAILVITIIKMKKIATAVLVLEKTRGSNAMVTDIPSFVYVKPVKTVDEENLFKIPDNITWEHAYFALLITFILIVIVMLYKHYQFKRKSKICLEITSEHSCILIDVIQLPMCPSFYEINIPISISDLEVKGDWYSPKLHVKWPEFTIKDSKSSTIKTIKSELCITFWQAFKLKSILKDTFFVYLYKLHFGIMIPIRHQ